MKQLRARATEEYHVETTYKPASCCMSVRSRSLKQQETGILANHDRLRPNLIHDLERERETERESERERRESKRERGRESQRGREGEREREEEDGDLTTTWLSFYRPIISTIHGNLYQHVWRRLQARF